ncbi:MAG: hypothetical protein HKO65_04085 [Gemmatimonadetes bacterium]|nr:hypothetical protein [Gemmatimonadota bacterium]
MEHIRRRWLFCLVVFAMAAGISAGLSFRGDLAGTGLGQGVGLALLGGLPLFAVGSLLGAMGGPGEERMGVVPGTPIAAPAVFGFSLGFLVTGSLLIPNAAPHTLYLFSLVVLSAGALLQGAVLDARVEVGVLESRSGRDGELRVERRMLGSSRRELKVLLAGGRIRGAQEAEGGPGRMWEVATLLACTADGAAPGSALFLGGGSGVLAAAMARQVPGARFQVVEESQALVEMAQAHFSGMDAADHGEAGVGESIQARLAVRFDEPLSAPEDSDLRFPLIVVDCQALPSLGGVPFFRDADWRFLHESLEFGGSMVMGGLPGSEAPWSGAFGEWMRKGSEWFDEVMVYREDRAPSEPRLLPEIGVEPEFFVRFTKPGAAAWPLVVAGFRLQPSPGS